MFVCLCVCVCCGVRTDAVLADGIGEFEAAEAARLAAKKADKFKVERSKHYNEYQKLEEFKRRKEVGLVSDDDDDEEEEEGGDSAAKRQ